MPIDLSNLTATEKKYLENLADQYWRMSNLYTVVNKEGKVVPFKPNWGQLKLIDEITPRHLVPKGRQMGVSTFLNVFALDCCLWTPNFSALIIAHNLDDAEKLFWRNIRGVFERLPPEIRDDFGVQRERSRDLRFSNGSMISVATSGRSGSYNFIHVSEMGTICLKYPDKADEIISGTFEAAAPSQYIVVESTGDCGPHGWYYNAVMDAKRAQDEKRKLTPMDWRMTFLEWWCHPDYVASPLDVIIPEELVKYFDKLKAEHGIDLSPARKAWYVGKWKSLGDKVRIQYPCIAGDVPIFTPKGIVRMDQAEPDGSRILGFTSSGEKDCLEIRTDLGYTVTCTHDHQILTPSGFMEAKSLALGDEVSLGRWCETEAREQVKKYHDIPCVESSITIDEEFAEFMGFYVGDGSYHANTLSIVCTREDDDVLDRVRYLMTKFVGRPNERVVGKHNGGTELRIGCVRMESPLRHLGLIKTRDSGGIVRRVCVPDEIKKSPLNVIRAFLRGLFEADGFAQRNGTGVALFSKYNDFLADVQMLLLMFGITCRRRSIWKGSGVGSRRYLGHEIKLRTNEAVRFAKEIGFISTRKMDRLVAVNEGKMGGLEKRLKIAESDKIRSIDPVGKRPVYDIQTDDEQFSAGGIIVHNCYLEECFEVTLEGVWYEKQMLAMRKEGRITKVPHQKGVKVDTWWDLGMDDAMAIWFVQEVGREMHLIRYEQHQGEQFSFYADRLRDLEREFGYHYGVHIAPHDIEVRELGAGSRWETAARLGLRFVVAPKLDVVDGIEAVRNDMSRWWIDAENCAMGIKALDAYRKEWDERRGTFKTKPLHDWASDGADAARNGVTGRVSSHRPMARKVEKGRRWAT